MPPWEFIKEDGWLMTLVFLAFGLLILVFFYVEMMKDKKCQEEEKRQRAEKADRDAIVDSLVSIYFTALEITLSTGMVKVILIPEFLKKRFNVNDASYEAVKENFIENFVTDGDKENVREFLDYDSLIENIKTQGYQQKNYLGITQGWCRITVVPVKNKETGEIEKMVLAIASIDEEKKREEKLKYRAEHDHLTGALNRTAYSRLEKEYSKNVGPMAVMIMDIDNFKTVNDTYGHNVGDDVLKEVATLLQNSFRKTDHVIRYGGDEFVILFPEFDQGFEERIVGKVKNINEVLQHPTKDGIPPVTVSAGIRTFEGSYNDVLLKQADIALYYTKQHGRDGCTVYQSFLTPAED